MEYAAKKSLTNKALIVAPDIEVGSIRASSIGEHQRDQVVAVASGITEIKDDSARDNATLVMSNLKKFLNSVESARKNFKAPFTAVGKKIEEVSHMLADPAQHEYDRIQDIVSEYQENQIRIALQVQKEEQAKIERANAEAQKALDDIEIKFKATIAELESKRNVFDISSKSYATFDKMIDDLYELNGKMRDKIEVKLEKKIEVSQQVVAFNEPTKTDNTVTVQVPRFEVVDISKVYAANPTLVKIEIRAAEVNALIRAGIRQIDGLKVWMGN